MRDRAFSAHCERWSHGIRSSMPRLLSSRNPHPDWNDGRWQLRHSITDAGILAGILRLPETTKRALESVAARYPIRITPYYLSLAKDTDPNRDPILRQCVPSSAELAPCGRAATPDPLAEADAQPVEGLVRRYPDRALLLTTSRCAVHCRHCFRKRLWTDAEPPLHEHRLADALEWLRTHSEVREVILSGGDPLMLPWRVLEHILAGLRTVPSVEWIRLGTRVPVVLPQRLSRRFCNRLARYGPLWCVTQFNHPAELTPAAAQACDNLLRAGIPVLNQTVLLRGVNDASDVLAELFRGLVRMRVKPYYLFLADPAEGAMHFRTSIEEARRLHAALRGRVSGLAVPTLAADLPEGGGKVVLERSPQTGSGPDGIEFQSFNGRRILLPDSPSP